MDYKEILIFDISGEYGHFRKYNTTTSPLTYSIPTRTAIAGMLGAILGMERETSDGVYPEGAQPVQEFFSKNMADIAIQIINPVKKENIGFNLINTKNWNSYFNIPMGRTQIEFELLKDVKYRLYISHTDQKVFETLKNRIISNNHHFTPYLGLAQFTTFVEYVGHEQGFKQFREDDFIEIISAINMSQLNSNTPIRFEQQDFFYSANNMPIEMNKDREVLEYSEVLIEKNGKPISVNTSEYYVVGGYGNIMFL